MKTILHSLSDMRVVDAAYLLAGLVPPIDSKGIRKAPTLVSDMLDLITKKTGAVALATMPEQRSTITQSEFRRLSTLYAFKPAHLFKLKPITKTQESQKPPGLTGATDEWVGLAVERGWAIIKEAAGRWFPTQTDLAKKIEREFREAKPRILSLHGQPLQTSTIERELKRHRVSCKRSRAKANLDIRKNCAGW